MLADACCWLLQQCWAAFSMDDGLQSLPQCTPWLVSARLVHTLIV